MASVYCLGGTKVAHAGSVIGMASNYSNFGSQPVVYARWTCGGAFDTPTHCSTN